jgi:hypothetical protein
MAAGLWHSYAHAGRHLHPLGETAVGVNAIQDSALADIGVPGQALRTRTAPPARARHHALPDVQIGDCGSDLQDDAHELMAQDDRSLVPAYGMDLVQGNPLWSRKELGEIGAAERSHEWGHEYFVRPGWVRFGNFLDAYIEWAMINGCFHAGSFSCFSFLCPDVSRAAQRQRAFTLWIGSVFAAASCLLGCRDSADAMTAVFLVLSCPLATWNR